MGQSGVGSVPQRPHLRYGHRILLQKIDGENQKDKVCLNGTPHLHVGEWGTGDKNHLKISGHICLKTGIEQLRYFGSYQGKLRCLSGLNYLLY